VIGIEYACIAAALDIPVTLIERRPRILDFVDQQIVEALSYHMRSQGVIFRLGEEVEEVTKSSEGKVCAKLKSGKKIWSDALLYAVGRQANTDSLNLAAGELAADDAGPVQGELTIRGVTRKVTFAVEGPTPPAKDPWGNTRIAISATTKINRKDFGLTWNAALETGGILVGDEVTITLDVEFIKA
jgi:Pyridine nucleotide-disulphide oxidoreductase/YceI-like domain